MKSIQFLLFLILLIAVNSSFIRISRDASENLQNLNENKINCDGTDCQKQELPSATVGNETTCLSTMFTCVSSKHCISITWVCDFDKDCNDGSDEENCEFKECDENKFTCDNHRCINKAWLCDGENDCGDLSDEKNCTSVCADNEFKCESRDECIPIQWRCDHNLDCVDGSDEKNCNYKNNSTAVIESSQSSIRRDCYENEFKCDSGACISVQYVCDGLIDCVKGEDEKNCPTN